MTPTEPTGAAVFLLGVTCVNLVSVGPSVWLPRARGELEALQVLLLLLVLPLPLVVETAA